MKFVIFQANQYNFFSLSFNIVQFSKYFSLRLLETVKGTRESIFRLSRSLISAQFQFGNTLISWHVFAFTNSHAFVCSGPKSNINIFLARFVGHIFVERRYIFLFCMFSCAYSMVGHAFY